MAAKFAAAARQGSGGPPGQKVEPPAGKANQPRSPRRVRTPTMLQIEAVECGAVALGIVLGYHGRNVPVEELREVCGISRDGSKAVNILKAARSYGLAAKGFKYEVEQLRDLPVPFIVFWNFYHFLVVEGMTPGKVYLNDPAGGPTTVTEAEFDAGFTGVVLMFEPGPDFAPGGPKADTVRSLASRLATSAWGLAYCVAAGLLLVGPNLAAPVLTQVFIDQVVVHGLKDFIRPLLVGMVLVGLLKGVLRYLQLHFLRRLNTKLAVVGSGRFLWHALNLPMRFYAQRSAGEVCSRLNVTDEVAEAISGKLATTAIDAVMAALYLALLLTYDSGLTAIGLVLAASNLVVLRATSRMRADATLKLGMEEGKAQGVAIAGLQGIETLKSTGQESAFFARLAGCRAKAAATGQRLTLQEQALASIPELLETLSGVVVLILGGLKVMHGDMTIGMLVAFQALMGSFLGPACRLLGLTSLLETLGANLTRLDDVLRYEPDPAVVARPKDENAVYYDLQGYLELRDVTFGYSPFEPPLIRDFCLKLKPGQRVALVGGSGSGKSTVGKLITGLYQPWSGEIRFDGELRADLPRRVLSNAVALVDQDVFQFGGTVRENLTLWDATMPDRDLIRAARDAEIHDIIVALPQGYDGTLLEGGANLSGGQRQRLEIARALAKGPSILVLDEATSALDPETERLIDRHLRKRGCTCVIIAHRLSTVRDCDEIVVLDRGEVVQRGSHDQLLREGGHYARLILTETQPAGV
jgi:NHLM bacteriocin system ABC transporter peptidase/ATP-binding protein